MGGDGLGVQPVECVITAAGRSARMGDWKPLLPFRGRSIVETVVATALRACARVILVTGYRGDELARLFADEPRVAIIHNPAWEAGMFSSQQKGIAAVRTARFFITPADMPLISADAYGALLAAAPADAVFPVYGGRRGHPVLFTRQVGEAALREDPSAGRMRDVAGRFRCREIEWTDDSIQRDIDTRENYKEIMP
jgi:molybdenum cofactor cytidylyltransferase